VDRGKNADPNFKNLLPLGSKIKKLTPLTGSVVKGVCCNAGKDELALLVAQRKVVAFRDQDFADIPLRAAADFASYFGPIHIHPISGSPECYPEIHIVHRGSRNSDFDETLLSRNSSVHWHTDITFELQPAGISFLYVLEQPETGGDTLFANQVEACNRLSLEFRKRLHGLKAINSGVEDGEKKQIEWQCRKKKGGGDRSPNCKNTSSDWGESAFRSWRM